MPAGRFLLADQALTLGLELTLPDDLAHQARDVLRLAPGDTLRLLDGAGGEYPATITAMDRKRVTVRAGERLAGRADPAVRIVLCQGMLKAAKYEWVVQKGTELGVAAFVPLLCERAVAAAEEASESKRRRWAKIAAEALEQSGGTRLPELAAPRPLMHSLAGLPPGAIALIPWEEAAARPLRSALQEAVTNAGDPVSIAEVRLFIGPEGGFSPGEIALAVHAGAIPVTLGPRILRAETAAIVAVTLALDALGALDAAPERD
ncbi:MAG TPA: 16S rRNA (uracil(1498)-N(3))-methyltransferase [Ktedonobacterales bacterium]|nr:16S rRNA (uracil(1498)-N(3))-methyltransferase [Ktedonobacterales bacterium]